MVWELVVARGNGERKGKTNHQRHLSPFPKCLFHRSSNCCGEAPPLNSITTTPNILISLLAISPLRTSFFPICLPKLWHRKCLSYTPWIGAYPSPRPAICLSSHIWVFIADLFTISCDKIARTQKIYIYIFYFWYFHYPPMLLVITKQQYQNNSHAFENFRNEREQKETGH